MMAFTGLQSDVESVAEELSVQASQRTGRGSSFGFPTLLSESDSTQSLSSTTSTTSTTGTDRIAHTNKSLSLISPRAMSSLTSHILYSRRSSPYYCEPLLVGLEPITISPTSSNNNNNNNNNNNDDDDDPPIIRYRPFLCTQDVIGAQSKSSDFICAGAASQSMYGIAEAMWRPDMDPHTLAKVCGQAFLAALERDCLSGYGAVVYVLTEEGGIMEYDLDARND